MRSMFTIEEVADMLDMSASEVESEIDNGYLSYSFESGQKRVTLYDLEKYMGPEQTRQITTDYLNAEEK